MSSLIIAVGGTGKSVAAVYLRLAKLFGKPADVLVVDMLFKKEEIDGELDKEGVKQGNFMTPWPGGTKALANVRFAEVIGLDEGKVARPVAQALFTEDELNTLVERGMNARPIVGATVATRKFWGGADDPQLDNFRQRVGQYADVFVVGSITGGTGSGVMPTLGKWLTEDCDRRVHGLLFLPWITIGAGTGDGPSDAAIQANAHAVLSYLKEVDPKTNPRTRGPAPFSDYVLLGLPDQLDPGHSATAAEHPLHLVAATYLLYYNEIMTRNPEVKTGPFYLELTAGGLRPGDMQPSRGFSLEQAINRQYWYREALLEMAGQQPDEAWDLMVPPLADTWLAWPALRETVRGLAVRAEGRGARRKVWAEMRKFFVDEAQAVKERLDWFSSILSRDRNHLAYHVSMEELEKQAQGYLRLALNDASKSSVPNLDAKVSWQEAARKAAELIANDIFNRLKQRAVDSITAGGGGTKTKTGSSTVFLPSGVHNPDGVNDIERKELKGLDELIQRFTGSAEAINMPDPQARRFQFGLTLSEALEEYLRDPSRPRNKWEESEPLAQFTALLEGVIFGKLNLRLFDLEDFGFRPSFDRRILGVLSGNNEVCGGTDPETLFFPAPEAWDAGRGPLRALAAANVTQRDTASGRYARALLRQFRDTFTNTFAANDRPLWLKMIDEYLHHHEPPVVDTPPLLAGWKQVGPVQLWMPGNQMDVRYLPVYEQDFASGATVALSGEFALRGGEIQLRVNNSDAGRIAYPQITRGGVSLRLMGAGAISLLAGARQSASGRGPQINYLKLREHCDALLGDGAAKAKSADVQKDPFKYPDVIRLPFQQDGLLAEYFIEGGEDDGHYGRQLLDALRGRGVGSLPASPPDKPPPTSVREGDRTYFFVAENKSVYVERYEGRDIKELSLLGQALWHIFVGEATPVAERQLFIDAGGNVVLEYGGARLRPGQHITLSQPNQQMHAADLRCLASKLQPSGADLLREAAKAWLAYFGLNPAPGDCVRSQFDLADWKWWRP